MPRVSKERQAIIDRKLELNSRRARANAEVRKVGLEMEILAEDCRHPAAYNTSHMGENCRDCPDCGNCLR